jgi:hypothetical protein
VGTNAAWNQYAGKCLHGLTLKPDGHICNRFVTLAIPGGGCNITEFHYAEVWNDILMPEWIVSRCLFVGTKFVLDGRSKDTGVDASFACFFENCIAVEVKKTQPTMNWPKILEVQLQRVTVVGFLKKRTPCSCLDQKHKQVKSIKKMGFCCNAHCSHSDGKFERSRLKVGVQKSTYVAGLLRVDPERKPCSFLTIRLCSECEYLCGPLKWTTAFYFTITIDDE